jgi:hypothetical protein
MHRVQDVRAKSAMQRPSIQGSTQKSMERTSPTMHRIEDMKNATSIGSSCNGRAAQGLMRLTRCSHSQHRQSARPISFRSRMPSPPSCSGRYTLHEATEHLPPFTTSIPVHKKAFEILTNDFRSQAGRS